MIKLVPILGLCNRLRAIDSALVLANDTGRELRIYWEKNNDVGSPFRLLFEPLPDPRARVVEGRLFPFPRIVEKLFRTKSYSAADYALLQSADLRTFAPYHSINITSYSRFRTSPSPFAAFLPIAELRDRIKVITSEFGEHTVGVHVRRTDNLLSIANSPDSLFIERMHREIDRRPDTRFYLATDSAEVKHTFSQHFGPRLMFSERASSRRSVAGMQDAVVELYVLAATKRIIGSHWSSYSETAAKIGRIPFEQMRVPGATTTQGKVAAQQ